MSKIQTHNLQGAKFCGLPILLITQNLQNTQQIPILLYSKYFIVENLFCKWSVVPWIIIIFEEKLIRRREPWINVLISLCLSKWGYHFFPNRSVRSRMEELYFKFCLLDFDPFLFRIVFVFLFESFERLSFVCMKELIYGCVF